MENSNLQENINTILSSEDEQKSELSTPKEVIEVLDLKDTLDNLFYSDKNIAKLDIFSWESRIWFKNIINKNSFFAWWWGESEYIDKIIHSPLTNQEQIQKRQDFFKYLIDNNLVEKLDTSYSIVKWEIQFKKLKKRNKKTWEFYINTYFEKNDIKQIISDVVSSKNIDLYTSPHAYLNTIDNFKEWLFWIINWIKKTFTNNALLLNQAIIFEKLLANYWLDRDFKEILTQMKENKKYFYKIIFETEKIVDEYLKFWAIIKLAWAMLQFEMQKASFDATKEVWYKDWYSPFETLKDNIKADSIKDNDITIFRAPNGIWKTFFEEKEMYINILAQSIGYTTASEANLRIYDKFYFLNRMQSSSKNDHCLSALWLEWKKLDELYQELKESNWNVIIYLDETGSTTDENNEFIILSKFLDAIKILEYNKIIKVRLSTHNQKIVNYYKQWDASNVWFYTFNDDRDLEEWERDSNTLNSFKKLLVNFETILEWLKNWKINIENKYWKYEKLDDLIKKMLKSFGKSINKYKYIDDEGDKWNLSNINKKYYKDKTNLIILKLIKFINIWKELIKNIELFIDWDIKKFKLPNSLKEETKNVFFNESELNKMSLENKGFMWSIYENVGEVQVIEKFEKINWKKINTWKKILIWKYRMYDDFEGYSDLDHYKSHRKNINNNYSNNEVWYTNISWYSWINNILGTHNVNSRSFLIDYFNIKVDIDEMDNIYDMENLLKIIFQKWIWNIKLVNERQKLIEELSNYENLDIFKTDINNLINFVLSSFKVIEKLYFIKDEWKYWDKIINTDKLENLSVIVLDDILYNDNFWIRDDSIFLMNLKNNLNINIKYYTKKAFKQFNDYCDMFKIDKFILINKEDFDEYRLLIEKSENENYDFMEDIELYKKYKSEMIDIFTKRLPEISKWLNITLDDFISWKYKINEFNSSKNIHIKSISNFMKFYNDEDLLWKMLDTLDKFESPILKWIKNYYTEIFWYVFWKAVNSKKLMYYLKKYKSEYKDEWYFLWRSYWKIKYNKHSWISEPIKSKDWLPNLISWMYYAYIRWLMNELRSMDDLVKYVEYIKKAWLNKVQFTNRKKLTIKWMWSNNIFDKNFVRNDIELTPENPIEIINWFNSSWKTEYIKHITQTIDSALNYWYVNADSMEIWWIDNYAYIDRIVTWSQDFSSGEQDIFHWMKLLKEIQNKDLVIINVDEIFSTMDKKFSTAFAYNFVGKLLEMWKLAIIISHNHAFVKLFRTLKWVKCNRFDSKLDKQWDVIHTYNKVPWAIEDSAGAYILKSLGIWKDWL